MNDYLRIAHDDWAVAQPVMVALIALMVIDIMLGLMCAFAARKLSSSISRKGMFKKAATLLLIAATAALDPFVPNVPIAMITTIFYAATEALSIVENAGRLGIPIPNRLNDALQKLRDDGAESPKP